MTQEEILDYNKRCADFLGVKLHESQLTMPHPHFTGYHSDWNWIMGVVEAIEKKVAWVNIKGCAVDISTIANTSAPSKKEAVVEAIDQFLIWYNENKSKN